MSHKRHIIIGDVHGCPQELEALLAKVAPKRGDTVVFAGDLFDKGPDSAGAVKVARRLSERRGIEVVLVMGNHEEKHARFRKHLDRFRETGKSIPIAGVEKKTAISDRLSAADLRFLDGAVLFHRIEDHDMLVVHGGVTPLMEELPPAGTKLSDLQGKSKKLFDSLLRVRYVDIDTGKMVALSKTDTDVHLHWTEAYDGRFGRVVYGHEPYTGEEKPVEGYMGMSVGIDLGCVFGGRLTALVVNHEGGEEAVSVEAFDKYASRTKRPGGALKTSAQMSLDLVA